MSKQILEYKIEKNQLKKLLKKTKVTLDELSKPATHEIPGIELTKMFKSKPI